MSEQSEARTDDRVSGRRTRSTTVASEHPRTDGPSAGDVRAGFAYAPGAPVAGNPVLFEVEAPSETAARYEWAFGDGGTATGGTASHVYDSAGEHAVTLTVVEDGGETRTVRKTVTVYREVDVEVGDRDGDGLVAVTLRAGEAFDPADAVAVDSLRVGAPTALAAGGGARPVGSESRGGDLRVRVPADGTRLGEGDGAVRLAGHTTDHVPVAGTVDAV